MTPEAEAELSRLRSAAEGRPSDAAIWTRYVSRLIEHGLKSRARKAARAARVKGPERKRLIDIAEGRAAPGAPHLAVAAALREDGPAKAARLAADLVSQYPDDPALLNASGVAHLLAGDPLAAETMLRHALSVRPDFLDAAANLGLALTRQGRGEAAVAVLEPFAERPDATLALRTNLAAAFLRADKPEETLSLTEALLSEAPDDPDILGLRADALLTFDRSNEARALLEPHLSESFALHDLWADILERTEGHEALDRYVSSLGLLDAEIGRRLAERLIEIGALDRAAEVARRQAEAAPTDPTFLRLLSLTAKWTPNDSLLPHLEALSRDQTLGSAAQGRAALAFAKAKLDMGDPNTAFEAMKRGNTALRKRIEYDVARDEREMAEIAGVWTEDTLRAARLEGGPAPVFIIGLPRTGSTLAETILSRHPAVAALGETPRIFAAASAVRRDATQAASRRLRNAVEAVLTPPDGKSVAIDKLLANFLNLGPLAAAFPHACFIQILRDYPATALSIFQTELPPTAHPYAMDLGELARYIVAFDRLMSHWAALLGDRLTRLRYEDLVTDPETHIPRLTAAAGLSFDPACLHPEESDRRVDTFSAAQVRRPIGTGSIERWRAMETGLKPLLDHLSAEEIWPRRGA